MRSTVVSPFGSQETQEEAPQVKEEEVKEEGKPKLSLTWDNVQEAGLTMCCNLRLYKY